MENKRKLLLVMGVCFAAVLCAACFGKKSNPVSSGGQSVSSALQTDAVLQQTQGSGDNEVAVGDIGEPTQTQKQTGEATTRTTSAQQSSTTSAGSSVTEINPSTSTSPSSTALPTTTTAVTPTTDQDGFFPGHR